MKDTNNEIRLEIRGTDKARYAPDDVVTVSALTENRTSSRRELRLELAAYHLDQVIYKDGQVLILEPEEIRTVSIKWHASGRDYQGYLICLRLVESGSNVIAQDTVGVDVSSDWLKFPRYGYLCDYGETEDAEEKIARMNRYHINVIEYYDWHALHHEPLPPEATRKSPGVWEDWAGRKIYGETLRRYLDSAHDRNMANMAYNMIYAGTDSFVRNPDGSPTEAAEWQVHLAPGNDKGEGAFVFHMGESPSGNGSLYIMNPLDPDWQHHIFAQEKHIFDVLDFDGWHGDTVGEWGRVTDAAGAPLGNSEQGEPVYEIKETYRQFLNAAKEALGGRCLSFNPVGAQGIEQVNTSRVDALYAEFWPWDRDRDGVLYDTYQSLVTEIERTMEESRPFSADGKGKSLAVKAYINYEKSAGTMNPPGVLLCDAAVYAAGGSRLEIGNGDHMLHVEYYPDDDILMGEELAGDMVRLADFAVAYENLLRDGQVTAHNAVNITGLRTSRDGRSDTVWVYTRAGGGYEILHLINLLGTDNTWRDEQGKKAAPTPVEHLQVKYYPARAVEKVCVASFSIEGGMSRELSYDSGKDAGGSYIVFTVPQLTYWDMVYMRERDE